MLAAARALQCAQERNQRHSQDRKIVALDAVEQLHAARLQPEHADSVADLRPFSIEIVGNERFRERPDLEARGLDMRPIELSLSRQRDGASQVHVLARKEAQMLGCVITIDGLVKHSTLDAHHAVAADHPIPLNAPGFRNRQLQCNFRRFEEFLLERILVEDRATG